ncbi:hypothetical protein FRC00_002159 [Tulasnella sp. 408]|nr:hypothetical protein FRC00_002159 [Tulasnella sp. 408]
MDAVRSAFQSSGQAPNSLSQVLPIQSIAFPGAEHVLRATLLRRPLHCVDLPYHSTDTIYLGLDRDKTSARTIRVLYPGVSDGAAGHGFTLSPPFEVFDMPTFVDGEPTVLCMWGETGRRMIHVDDVGELWVAGLSIPIGLGHEPFVMDVDDRTVISLEIPDSRLDLARYLAFDEVTGVCAVALGSGRIWIADPFCRDGLKDKDVPLTKIEFKNPPDPDPAWRFIPRKPWVGERGHPSRLLEALLPPMATKVYRWFPGKNNPQAFGSVKWFVNEVLHIPGPATALLVGTPYTRFSSGDSFEVIDVGGRLLSVERDDDMSLYSIKLLDANITFEFVAALLKGGGLLRDLPGTSVVSSNERSPNAGE